MSHRSYLKTEITVYGESGNAVFERSFNIIRIINEGADGICYEAFHKSSGKGVLKEFYPENYAYLFERNDRNQLGISKDFIAASEDFARCKEKFLEPYRMLLALKQSSNDRDVSSFIPHFEVYYGSDPSMSKDTEDTIYIWTPEPKMESFEKICREIHRYPRSKPEHKLVTVISAVLTLTKCVCALHSAGIIHRDIKPSNFGFIKRRGETLTQAISMFDIDSLCSIWDDAPDTVISEGFTEPEAGFKECSNQTDIFSIGATLFSAIVITEETRQGGFIYREDYYDHIKEMVADSELITASEANSHPRLRNLLVTIMKNCLCERRRRYKNCEALIADLNEAVFYALPPEIAKKSRRGEKWVLTEAEKSLDKNADKNSALSILYALYQHPLYKSLKEQETQINVLVVGFGNYGQKFLDACLQTGQIRGIDLNVKVITEDDTDKEIYISDRPALKDFFSVEPLSVSDPYGKISFYNINTSSNIQHDTNLIEYIKKVIDGSHIHYAFIALGDDEINRKTAGLCRKLLNKNGESIVCYASEGNKAERNPRNTDIIPVYVNGKVSHSRDYRELERMAFNTHLIWERDLNLKYKSVRKEFRMQYNHDSSMSCVISLKYKLASMGIDMETVSFSDAARRFGSAISEDTEKSRALKDELIWIEHRRWVTEKVCRGWTRIKDLNECVEGKTRDEKSKRHVCLLRSRPDRMLHKFSEIPALSWDLISSEEFSKFDDLDKMSVMLHRIYQKKAESIKSSTLLRNTLLSGIRAGLNGSTGSLRAFNEWYSCINGIWSGDQAKVRLYRSLKEAFERSLESLEPDRHKAVIQQIKAFDKYFFPVIASLEKKEWKQEDAAIIENIPFILTYSENISLIIPYNADSAADNVFSNISAAALISPARVFYLYQIERDEDIQSLMATLPPVLSYMDSRGLKASLEFVIGCPPGKGSKLADNIIDIGNGRIKSVHVINGSLCRENNGFYKYLPSPKGRYPVFAEQNNTLLSRLLDHQNFYDIYARYSFDSGNMAFETDSKCDLLKYIKKTPYITVKDLGIFERNITADKEMPEFYDDYESLWMKYNEDTETWGDLCALLRSHHENSDCLTVIHSADRQGKPESYRYTIPAICWYGASKVIDDLKKRGAIIDGNVTAGRSTESCEVSVNGCFGSSQEFDRLFSNVYALADPGAITIKRGNDESAGIWFDSLIASGVKIGSNNYSNIISLLEYFKSEGYINALEIDGGTVSFTYAANRVKKLLTSVESVSELYVYHQAKNKGIYDDVSLCNMYYGPGENLIVKCCVMTKGFSGNILPFAGEHINNSVDADLFGIRKIGINSRLLNINDIQ